MFGFTYDLIYNRPSLLNFGFVFLKSGFVISDFWFPNPFLSELYVLSFCLREREIQGDGRSVFLIYYIIYLCIWIISHLSRVHGMIKQKMSQIVSRQTHNVLHSDDTWAYQTTLYCIYQMLQKTFYCNDKNYGVWHYWLQKLLFTIMLYFMNWLIYQFWTRTGGWEFDYPHGAGTSYPSY